MRTTIVARLTVALLLLLKLSPALHAQVLADKVPGDSFVYLGWKGTDTPDNGYAGSHLQAVLGASKMQAAFEQAIPQLIRLLDKQEPQAEANVNAAIAIAQPLLRHPTALFVRPGESAGKPPRAGLICFAGADAKTLANQARDALEKSPEDKELFRIVESGEYVAALIGYGETDAKAALSAAGVSEATSLAKSPDFLATMTAANTKPASSGRAAPFITFYVDAKAGLALVDKAIEKDGKRGAAEWFKIRDALGLPGLHRVFVSANFDGPNWATSAFIAAPAPRTGIIKLLEGKAIAADTLMMIPVSAGGAQSVRMDIAGLVNLIRDTIVAVNPEGAAGFDQALGAAQMTLGVNPLTDVLEPLGDTWLLFSDESLAGNGTTGLLIVNKLDDAAKAERGLGAVWRVAKNLMAAPQRQAQTGVSLEDKDENGVKLSIVKTPTVQVGWTVRDGKLIVGMSPDAVVKVATDSPSKGLDQNDKFAALSKQLSGGQPITSFRFMDLPVTAPVMAEELKAQWQMVHAFAAQQGIELPDDPLPPIDVVKAHVAPAGEVAWMTDAGFHYRSATPFPGADAYSNHPDIGRSQVGVSAIAVSILLPSLNRARETANRVKCASNERQIGMAILLYSNDNKGQYPPDLGALLLTQDITLDAFVCPSSDNALPPDFQKMTPEQTAAWANANSNYIYGGKGLNNSVAADKIILIEKLDDHDEDGINCLFGDGHIEFVQPTEPSWTQVQELLKLGK